MATIECINCQGYFPTSELPIIKIASHSLVIKCPKCNDIKIIHFSSEGLAIQELEETTLETKKLATLVKDKVRQDPYLNEEIFGNNYNIFIKMKTSNSAYVSKKQLEREITIP